MSVGVVQSGPCTQCTAGVEASRPRAAAPLRSASTRSRIASATSSFDAERHVVLARRARRSSPRCSVGVEADVRARDVVEDDRVDALALELRAGALDRLRRRVSAAKPTSVCSVAALRAATPARMSSVGSRRSSRPPLAVARDLAGLGGSAARKSATARPPSAARGGARTRPRPPSASSAVVSTSIRRTPGGARQRDVGGDQGHVGAAARRPRSASARPMRPLERLPMKRTGSIGSRVPPAVTSDAQAVPGAGRSPAAAPRPRPAAARAPAAGRRRTRRARRAPRRRARSRARRARAASPGSPAWPRPRTCGRSSPGRRARGAVQARKDGREHRVGRSRRRAWRSCSPRRARPGRRRRSATSARWPIGSWSGGASPGNAPRSGSRSNSSISTGAPTMPSNDAGAHEPRRRRRHQHAHAVARLGRQPRELERLVGGDAAAHAEKDAGHRSGPARAPR